MYLIILLKRELIENQINTSTGMFITFVPLYFLVNSFRIRWIILLCLVYC